MIHMGSKGKESLEYCRKDKKSYHAIESLETMVDSSPTILGSSSKILMGHRKLQQSIQHRSYVDQLSSADQTFG